MTNSASFHRTNLMKNIESTSLAKGDVRALLSRIESRFPEAIGLEEANYSEESRALENYDELAQNIRDSFLLTITLNGSNGEELQGTIEDVFDSPNFPDVVTKVFASSETSLKVNCDFTPRNKVIVLIDFTKPKLLDFSVLPGYKTPNNSNFQVEGLDSSWVNGLYAEIENYLRNRKKPGFFLHKHATYDLFLWLIGMPFAFFLSYKVSGFVESFASFNSFFKSALYLYVGFATIIAFRIVYHYARWAFPRIEYKSTFEKAIRHQIAIGAISISLVGTLIWEAIKAVAS
ncbi:hypothetical protein ACFOND_14545 [Reinekea marina]|uniref:Uncharacterized protein n=1 Tax=Reinekea marina TaxID=1310421 RepID=A0ABV7WXJ8_9GAMM